LDPGDEYLVMQRQTNDGTYIICFFILF